MDLTLDQQIRILEEERYAVIDEALAMDIEELQRKLPGRRVTEIGKIISLLVEIKMARAGRIDAPQKVDLDLER
jgi:hypothetical protein